ncbi:MAG: hypothetical protein LBT53_00610 [Puniceicoccales bacterium]|jgi:hypothetical protein|nr:hypothetical protein [Puniceicoccales bacterium]
MKHTPLPTASAILAILALAAAAPDAAAQGVATPFGTPTPAGSGGGARQPAATPGSSSVNTNAGTAGNYSSSTAEGQSDKLFNTNSDSVDFENGTFQWKGKTFSIGNSKMMRAYFDSYLAAPTPAGNAKEYVTILNRIEYLLSPRNHTTDRIRRNSTQAAWNLLYDAAKFEADGDASSTLAALLYKTALMREELRAHERRDAELKRDKDKRLRELTRQKQGLEYKEDMDGDMTRTSGSGKNKTVTTPKPRQEGKARTVELTEFLTEARKDILVNQREYATTGLNARLQFQSQIAAYLVGRRFRHASIACAFYRIMFRGDAQDVKVGAKQVKELFPVSDFVPTIDSVDMLAKEAVKDVDTRMKAVVGLYDNGERFAAFERLQEVYFLGQYEPDVIFFDPAKKRVLREVWSNARDLQKLGDERDLARCEEYIDKLKALASDFPSVQIKSKVDAARQASDLALLDAQIAALNRDTAGAGEKLQIARKIWPTNPGLKEFASKVRDQGNLYVQKSQDFDRFLAAKQYREIFKNAMEMGLAFAQDKARAEKLKEVVENVTKIDTGLALAKEFDAKGTPNMSWDFLMQVAKLDENDPEVMKMRVALATKTGRYSALLDKAALLEKSGNYASSLTTYLAAQELNKLSSICRAGIDRASDNLIAQLSQQPPSAPAPAPISPPAPVAAPAPVRES